MPKISRTDAYSVANEIRDRVLARFPELRTNPIDGVWFAGSNVWTALLGEEAPADADWDIVAVNKSVSDVAREFGLDKFATIETCKKRPGASPPEHASDGICYKTDRGDVDVWSSPDSSILGALREYKTETHA